MAIEILKDDHLQKVNFRVKNKVRFWVFCSKAQCTKCCR